MSGSARAYLSSLEQIGIKLGLEQIRALTAALGHPDEAYPSIVIAGTNGKGSVTAMVERGLRAAGYRTGRYTSPHLVSIEERVAIDGAAIPPETFDRVAAIVQAAAVQLPAPPSFFEATTALGLEVFREAAIDIAVLEVGLGGRLDATNVVSPVAVAITAIDFDHEAYLGNTIEAIAREKAGVIKPGTVAVLAPNPPAVADVVRDACLAVSARLIVASDDVLADVAWDAGQIRLSLRTPTGRYDDMTLALLGRHQVDNAMTAVRVLEALDGSGRFVIPRTAVRAALIDVVWPGRLELRRWRGGSVLIDGAHNPAGARALASYVVEAYGRPVPFVVGVMKDKQAHDMLLAFATAASHVVATAARSDRAMTPQDVADLARSAAPALDVRVAVDAAQAIDIARTLGDPVVVAGSLYLAGEIRDYLA